MDATQLYTKINKDLANRIERLETHILDGSPSDLAEYKGHILARHELLAVQDDIKRVYARAINEDEHDS